MAAMAADALSDALLNLGRPSVKPYWPGIAITLAAISLLNLSGDIAAVADVFADCYADTAPFDRHPRTA